MALTQHIAAAHIRLALLRILDNQSACPVTTMQNKSAYPSKIWQNDHSATHCTSFL